VESGFGLFTTGIILHRSRVSLRPTVIASALGKNVSTRWQRSASRISLARAQRPGRLPSLPRSSAARDEGEFRMGDPTRAPAAAAALGWAYGNNAADA
jgi:hypothetical protein